MFAPAWSQRTVEDDPGAPFFNETRVRRATVAEARGGVEQLRGRSTATTPAADAGAEGRGRRRHLRQRQRDAGPGAARRRPARRAAPVRLPASRSAPASGCSPTVTPAPRSALLGCEAIGNGVGTPDLRTALDLSGRRRSHPASWGLPQSSGVTETPMSACRRTWTIRLRRRPASAAIRRRPTLRDRRNGGPVRPPRSRQVTTRATPVALELVDRGRQQPARRDPACWKPGPTRSSNSSPCWRRRPRRRRVRRRRSRRADPRAARPRRPCARLGGARTASRQRASDVGDRDRVEHLAAAGSRRSRCARSRAAPRRPRRRRPARPADGDVGRIAGILAPTLTVTSAAHGRAAGSG